MVRSEDLPNQTSQAKVKAQSQALDTGQETLSAFEAEIPIIARTLAMSPAQRALIEKLLQHEITAAHERAQALARWEAEQALKGSTHEVSNNHA
jgi:hypothetical protein